MASVVQGNRPLRIFAAIILLLLVIAHFMDAVDLTSPSVLWIMIFMAINAIQASFTGFCPMFKDKEGNCVACGVQCSDGSCETHEESKKESSCCGSSGTGCGESNATELNEKEVNQSSCCSSNSGCCSSSDCVEVKVLGTGCKTCDSTAKLIQQTADEMGVKICITKIEDVAEIASYGVMSTPAVVIKDEVFHSGGMPSKAEIEDWLK